jgi:hypothetical protein
VLLHGSSLANAVLHVLMHSTRNARLNTTRGLLHEPVSCLCTNIVHSHITRMSAHGCTLQGQVLGRLQMLLRLQHSQHAVV